MTTFELTILTMLSGLFLITLLFIIEGKPTRKICLKWVLNTICKMGLLVGLVVLLGAFAAILPDIIKCVDRAVIYYGTVPTTASIISLFPSMSLLIVLVLFLVALKGICNYNLFEYTLGERTLMKEDLKDFINRNPRLAKVFGLRVRGEEGGN